MSAGSSTRIEDLGVLEDTLVYYIIGDNGASAEGTVNGSFNEMFIFNGADALETPEYVSSKIDEFGTPTAYNHYAVGWAHAMDTPYQWTKQVASHWGGTRNGTIVHWPQRLRAPGVRCGPSSTTSSTWHRPCSRPPGLPEPTVVDGVPQRPFEGVSMAYSFDEADARRATHDAVLRDVLQPRDLPRGLDGRHPPQHAVGDGRPAAVRGRRVGALRHDDGLEPVPRPGGRACRRSWPSSRSCG